MTPEETETPGRYIVTFREGASLKAVTALEDRADLRSNNLVRSADFADSDINMDRVPVEGGAIFGHLNLAVVNVAPDAAEALALEAGEDTSILAIEPEGIIYAINDLKAVSLDYLRGDRDCAQNIYTAAGAPQGAKSGLI